MVHLDFEAHCRLIAMQSFLPALPASSPAGVLRASRNTCPRVARGPVRTSAVAAPDAPAQPRSFEPENDWGVHEAEPLTPELAKQIEEAGIDFENSQLKWLSNSGRVGNSIIMHI